VVVTRNGSPVAVIIAMQDEDEIERLLMAHSPQLNAILERSRQQIREGKWLSHEEFWTRAAKRQKSKTGAKGKKPKVA
jgi:predicted NAD-dependent protein-ADP-ribosyltransferase YbiA (DUF1768 family)